jgi:hypothetical protein
MLIFVEIYSVMNGIPGRRRNFLVTTALLFFSCILIPCITNHASVPPYTYKTQIVSVLSLPFPLLNGDTPMGNFQSITIPLKRAGRLFLIEAIIDNQEGNLVFDTGSSGLVLNKTYFRKYVADEKTAGGGVTGSVGKVSQIQVKRIQISNLYYEKVLADVSDLGHIENRRGVKILGLFGLNMIQGFEVIFDANNNQLQLIRVDRNGNHLSPSPSSMKYDFTHKIETFHNILLLKGKIGEKPLNFCLDTGAETNVLSSHVSKNVMHTIQINRRSSLSGAGAATTEVLYGTMSDFICGNHQLGAMETIITDLDYMSEAYGRTIDGMLGYDFWEKGIFCINFEKNEISICIGKGVKK